MGAYNALALLSVSLTSRMYGTRLDLRLLSWEWPVCMIDLSDDSVIDILFPSAWDGVNKSFQSSSLWQLGNLEAHDEALGHDWRQVPCPPCRQRAITAAVHHCPGSRLHS
eukprot:756247-Hanusia_phi.AAC.10